MTSCCYIVVCCYIVMTSCLLYSYDMLLYRLLRVTIYL